MDDTSSGSTLGRRLRELRKQNGWSLREVAARSGVNHGYLSQLERGEVTQPAPAMLHKLARGYEEPFIVLMQWADYVNEDSPAGQERLSANQVRALKYLGDEVSDDELEAIKSILEVLRNRRATFSKEAESLDSDLSLEVRQEIRAQAVRLLRRSDAIGVFPTPLEQVMEIAGLVAAGEILLDDNERRSLRKKFGGLVDLVLQKLQGVIHFRAREVWVQSELHEMKKRFVVAHEIGHDVLPWQHDLFAYLDDEQRLRQDVRISYEREANQAAIELLAQGDLLRKHADDSELSTQLFLDLSSQFGISIQGASRRIVEETRQDAALAIRFRKGGYVGPPHLYSSRSFSNRFGWRMLPGEAEEAARTARRTGVISGFYVADLGQTFVEMNADSIDIWHAVITLFTPSKNKRSLRRLGSSIIVPIR